MDADGDHMVDQRSDEATPMNAGGNIVAASGSSMDGIEIGNDAIEVFEGPKTDPDIRT